MFRGSPWRTKQAAIAIEKLQKKSHVVSCQNIDSYYVGEEVYLQIPPMSRFRDHDDELLYFGTFCRLETDVSAKKLILCNERGELHNKIYYVKLRIYIIEEE